MLAEAKPRKPRTWEIPEFPCAAYHSAPVKVDYYLPPVPPGSVEDHAGRAVRLHFDGVFAADTSHDPFLAATLAARGAPDREIGTAIAVAFARSPMTVAYAAWDLASLTGGRFLLGLGSQIKAHITRRFSMPWSSPGPRMREYVAALRAIWAAWQGTDRLDFRGDFYDFTLMTPFFDPGPIPHPQVPVYLAGVGEYMCRLAGEEAEGFHVHPFHTVRYLDDVVLPHLRGGAAAAGRTLDDIERVATIFVITGRTAEERDLMRRAVKLQVAFYASTPAYSSVLDLHGWDFGPRLTALSRRGEWMAMGDVIPDEVLDEVAVVAPLDELGGAIRRRFGSRVQRTGFYVPDLPGAPPLLDLDDREWIELVEATRG